MVQFISERSLPISSPDSVSRKARVDSKGRISIPSDIRRSLGLETGSELVLEADLAGNMIVLSVDGQSGVGDCGYSGPDAQTKKEVEE